ncbi:transcriptional repressor LexA [Abyssibacter profundi]|uniref:LexA repressor n=1 Tax=Abyssibacter profundi TaxID=2182787 RepID=A0A363UL33_9GAMM|nr:transcriptional repressor LexA [Abyssibacter profundi]PWN56107.1 repressor LexA [Abyssibacter profundi]
MLTRRQTEVLDFIRQFAESESMPPTLHEIAKGMGFSSDNAARDHVRALARKGAIDLVEGTSRGIRLRDAGIPLIGRVAAGSPILAAENVEKRIQTQGGLFNEQPDYFLRVVGESMRDAGIMDGDLLAVKKSHEARNGQIIVARLDEDVTVKEFERRGRQVRLIAHNPEFAPIEVDLATQPLAIEGRAVGVFRSY